MGLDNERVCNILLVYIAEIPENSKINSTRLKL